jgi:hypothetical protein
LHISWDLEFRDIICESDSETTLTLIKDGVPPTHLYALLINNICSFMLRNWNVVLAHILREGNSCVDWLTNLGASLSQELKIISNCPSSLSNYCLADSLGIQFLRL